MNTSLLTSLDLTESVSVFLDQKRYIDKTPLCHLMTQFGSDKGSGYHNYTTFYHHLFKDFQNLPVHLFELGLGTNYPDVPSNMGYLGIPGASLCGWRSYFSKASIYGADIDERILFQSDRIQTFFCDQTNPSSIMLMYLTEALSNIFFDVIIEDGLHEFDANITFLENSLFKLKKGGIYIAEDLSLEAIDRFSFLLKSLKEDYALGYINTLSLPNAHSPDNALLIIQK